MDAPVSNSEGWDFQTELVDAVAFDAIADAENVCLFLRLVGFDASPKNPIRLPGIFMLRLGAALRLLEWERLGFHFHIEAGLPSGKNAIRDAFSTALDADNQSTEFARSIMRLSLEKFAWSSRRELGAVIAMDAELDDAALDAMAEFLWASRRAKS